MGVWHGLGADERTGASSRRGAGLGVFAGRLTMTAAAGLMGVSRRQAHRLARQFAEHGAAGLRHRARGRPSNHQLGPHVRQLAIAYVTENYRDFGPTLASQMLLERHGLSVSRETLRQWMREDGLWLSRKQRRQLHHAGIQLPTYCRNPRMKVAANAEAECWGERTATNPASMKGVNGFAMMPLSKNSAAE